MGKAKLGVAIFAGAAIAASTTIVTNASAEGWGKYQVEDRRSGYTYAKTETRAIQEDEMENPGMIWVDEGASLWETKDGTEGKSCSSCHGEASESLKGVAARMPRYDDTIKGVQNIEGQINYCRTERMKAKAWKYESGQLLAMTTYVRHQSLGMPMNVSIDGKAAPHFEKGRKFYYQRRGQLDMACKHCHEDNPGGQIRANILSQGQSNGFPVYRLKWQKVGSTHRRFRGCNKQVRSTPFGYASKEYLDLELYVAWRGRGLPVETPAVRN